MRILHLISSLDPACGGPPVVAASLASAQARLGHAVTLASIDQPARREVTLASLQRVPGIAAVNVYWLEPRWLKAITLIGNWVRPSARQPLEEQLAQADMVHLHCVWDLIVLEAAKICRRLRRPYCQVLHGMLDPWCMQQKTLKKKMALALGFRKMLDGAAFLHVLNDDEGRLIAPLGLKAPAAIIPNGIFAEEIDSLPPPGRFYARHPALEDRPYVLFLGRLHYKKGLDYLAEAFKIAAAACPEVRLVVAGPDGGARGDFDRRIADAGLAERVHVIGPIYGAAKFEALVDCACFCLPSRQEGFSMAIVEALASGVPAVISAPCHFPEVASAGAGLVTPLDARAVAAALTRVLQDADLRSRMGRAGRELIAARYTWPTIAEQALQAYGRFAKVTLTGAAERGAVLSANSW